MKLLGAFALVGLALGVLGDTEIRNFHLPVPPSQSSTLPRVTGRLDKTIRQVELTFSKDHTAEAIVLDLDNAYDSWTTRLSWPASNPAKFDMKLIPTFDDHIVILEIISSPLTPRFPHPYLSKAPNSPFGVYSLLERFRKPEKVKGYDAFEYNTTAHLVLEPLLFGVLPVTTVPTLYTIAGGVVVSALLVPFIIKFIEYVPADCRPRKEAKEE